MLSNTLVTNEVKNAAGTEIEFGRITTMDRKTVFAAVGEPPSAPHRLTISHQESGAGITRRRRSVVRIDKTVANDLDASMNVVVSAYLVLDAPVGAKGTTAEFANVLAEVLSFCASLGASTTILYDGTGNGAAALISGGL